MHDLLIEMKIINKYNFQFPSRSFLRGCKQLYWAGLSNFGSPNVLFFFKYIPHEKVIYKNSDKKISQMLSWFRCSTPKFPFFLLNFLYFFFLSVINFSFPFLLLWLIFLFLLSFTFLRFFCLIDFSFSFLSFNFF